MSEAASAKISPQFKKILFATDLSPCCEVALPYLRQIALKFGSRVHALHILPIPVPDPTTPMASVCAPGIRYRDLAAKEMAELPRSAALAGIPCEVELKDGPAAKTIVSTALRQKADLIIMGTHGRRGMNQFIMGSVAEAVIRNASCPVITVGPAADFASWADGASKTIVFASDLTPGSTYALEYATFLARAYQSRLVAVHRVEDNLDSSEAETVWREARQTLGEIVNVDSSIEAIVVEASTPAEAILSTARDRQAGLIVMGAHRTKSHAWEHLPWTVHHRVACQAACPVMTASS